MIGKQGFRTKVKNENYLGENKHIAGFEIQFCKMIFHSNFKHLGIINKHIRNHYLYLSLEVLSMKVSSEFMLPHDSSSIEHFLVSQ